MRSEAKIRDALRYALRESNAHPRNTEYGYIWWLAARHLAWVLEMEVPDMGSLRFCFYCKATYIGSSCPHCGVKGVSYEDSEYQEVFGQ